MLPTLSHLSVNHCPESCLRFWSSSRYLHIPPLHREFHFPLQDSRQRVLNAEIRLSLTIKHSTFLPAYARFTPNNSEQRLPHTYYRGCWHVISRGCRIIQSSGILLEHPYSSYFNELYNPKTFIAHAAWLRQAFAHCARFLTAASRRSLDRISVPMWPFTLSGRLSVVALVSSYLTNKLIEFRIISKRMCPSFAFSRLCGISFSFPKLSPSLR